MGYALGWLMDYARSHAIVFCDDVWAAGLKRPLQPKALGALFQKAARLGIIERGGYKPSASSNGSPKPWWSSRLWAGGTP